MAWAVSFIDSEELAGYAQLWKRTDEYVHPARDGLREPARSHLFAGQLCPEVAAFHGHAPVRCVEDCGQGSPRHMTENEQRARDILTREDVLVRSVSVVGLIAMFLLVLLAVNP